MTNVELFELILESNGWHTPDTAAHNPELNVTEMILSRSPILFEAFLFPDQDLLTLNIKDIPKQVFTQFHFVYEHSPKLILEWIVKNQSEITVENGEKLVLEAGNICPAILDINHELIASFTED